MFLILNVISALKATLRFIINFNFAIFHHKFVGIEPAAPGLVGHYSLHRHSSHIEVNNGDQLLKRNNSNLFFYESTSSGRSSTSKSSKLSPFEQVAENQGSVTKYLTILTHKSANQNVTRQQS